MLLDKKVIKDEFFFCMPDIGDIGKDALEYFGVQVDFDLVVGGHILRGIHAAQKRQAYCLTTTKKKHHSAMQLILRSLSLIALAVFTFGCYDVGYDRSPGRGSEIPGDSNRDYTRVPQRDRFIGSIYFATGSSALSRAAASDLARMANRMQERRHASSRVVIVGYADRRRGADENSELAAERAQRVAIALEKQGVELDRIIIDSRSIRITRNTDAERRVDLYFESGFLGNGSNLFPVLVAFFLLCTFALAVVIFRRR